MSSAAESSALHARVRAFARAALQASPAPETFDDLALAIQRYQLQSDSVSARLARHAGRAARGAGDIPAVPADAFRRGRVALHGPESDVVRFQTSGTTGGSGSHAFRTLDTYRELTVAWGRAGLLGHLPERSRVTVLALAPSFEPERRSSLGFMLHEFMCGFDARPLSAAPGAVFDANEPGRWLVRGANIDVAGLRSGVAVARRRAEPVLLLATSFALVWLLEALGSERLPLPPGSVVMQTGGFKGRSRTLDAAELAARVAELFAVGPERLIGEYGMTELSSQLYDSGFGRGAEGHSVFASPPWLRVDAVDPVSFEPLRAGEAGLARFTDLANVDSALCVLTQDHVRCVRGGIVLLGRKPSARLRGCSLAIEELRGNAGKRKTAPGTSGESRLTSTSWPPALHDEDALSRVERLLQATRLAVRPGSPERRALCAEIAMKSGISASSVEATLDACLELEPSQGELRALVRGVRRSARAHVILPANVFVAAHRALAVALASAPHVFVKPSSRDPGLARAIWTQAPELFEIVSELAVEPGDRVWAYGSDTTMTELRERLPRGAWLHAHGEGFGIVLVDLQGGERPRDDALAAAIALDTARFDQRGCLSPRFVLVRGDAGGVQAFTQSVRAALVRLEDTQPRGRLARDELADAAWYQACAACFEQVWRAGEGCVVQRSSELDPASPRALEAPSTFLDVPPLGRHLEIVHTSELELLVKALAPWLTSIGVSSPGLEVLARRAAPRARVVRAGAMQTPRFDGPVDLRADPDGELLA